MGPLASLMAAGRPSVKMSRSAPGVGLLDRFQPLDGLGEARVATVS